MSSLSLLSGRDLGIFPISMSTSLAIEGLANLTPDREKVLPLPITQIDSLMVNVRTLIRNIESAFKNDEVGKLAPTDMAAVVIEEMDQIVKAMREISPGQMSVGFYICSYDGLPKLKTANLIVPTTPAQNLRKEKVVAVMRLLEENFRKGGRPVKQYDMYPEPRDYGNDRMAFLTHLPMDLIKHRQFREVFLLESNTGKLKPSSELHTKLHSKRAAGLKLPFNMLTLQVFGDGKIFKPMNPQIVDQVVDVATKGKWTPFTTADKMRFWIGRMSLQGYAAELMGLIKD